MPSRTELLADHFIRSAGVAGIAVDVAGTIAAIDVVSMFDGRSIICCAAGSQGKVALLAEGRVRIRHDHAEALAAVHAAAAEAGIGLTPFDKVIRRAFAALETVELTLTDMQRSGQMREFNRDFAARRKADPALRYPDHLHQKKMGMLEALARQAR